MKTNFTFKRVLSLVLAVMMLLTAMPVGVLAEPGATGNQSDGKFELKYDDGSIVRKEDYINETKNLPVVPKKTENAEELIKNPDMPKLYTVHSDFKVQRGDDLVVSYQPYIATAGAEISQEEKAKIDKLIEFPILDGYTSATPKRKANITYEFIEKRAKAHNNLVGDEYKGHYDYIYTPKPSKVNVKHLFQDINDFNKYTNPDGTITQGNTIIYPNGSAKQNASEAEIKEHERITTPRGVTGTSLTIQPLPDNEISGYVPESTNITTQVPENPDNFVVELRYNLAHYNIKYDTAGGTEIPARTLYYGQVIPKIADADVPTKVGGTFQGWKPSVDLKTKGGKTYKANEIIAVATGGAIEKLDNDLIMPPSNVTFTAVWKDKEKADYAVQFWAEKADHADGASLADKYDYIGTRVYKDQATGSRPDLDDEPVKDIVFPDLDQKRLAKIWAGARFNRGKNLYLNKFYVYNQALTHEENKDTENVNLVKSVDSTGKTVYNIYYDRQVYDLYFTKSNAQPAGNTFYPEIWGYDKAKGEVVKKGSPGNPYHYKARFNQLMLGWPNDAMQTKGFSKGMQSFGWGPNYTKPNWPGYLDTPPYRLNADEFLDMPNYDTWGGYTKPIDKGDGTSIPVDRFDFTTLSFGINQAEGSMPHHMDFWMDGFKPNETIIRYDLYRFKADTNSESYRPKYPKVQGFTGKRDKEPAEFLDEAGVDDKNEERKEVTPFPAKTYTVLGDKLPLGKMKFINFFFSDIDEFGDPLTDDDGEPLVKPFEKNGYLKFEYSRNKYPLRFNYDPSVIKGDSEFNSTNQLQTFYEFPLKALSPDADTEESYKTDKPKNILDNPVKLKELELTDLVFNDANDGNKLKVKRPDNLSDQMVFKGWALDPAGTKLIWENPGEKMPNHPVNLYAKWGEPDYKWKVTFDPNGGKLSSIDEAKVTQKRKTIQEGDIGQIEKNTYAKKEANEGDKQVFTVIQRQKLVEPKKPTKKGYDFMGWEVIRYKKDAKTGDYTDEIDDSYRKDYKVPELYSFGNDVVAPVYLKAIWVRSDVEDIESHHHFLDNDYKEVSQDIQILRDRRVGSYLAAVGSRQNDERILVPKDEWDELEKYNTTDLDNSMTYADYMKLDKDHPRVNSYSQQIRIEPKEIPDPNDNTKLIANPDVKLNQFHFYYRPFRHREYKVNYLDERGREEVKKFIEGSKKAFAGIKNNPNLTDAQKDKEYKDLLEANRTDFEAIRKKYAIIDQEAVKNVKRHFDARNYRPIAGWVLDDKPQQQLFFDIYEDTSAFYGINETGFDEINFFYKDVRVVETNKDDPVPDGYVRVTFKAADGGSFGKDDKGNDIKELFYDVVKGLRSQLLPVPKELKAGETKDPDKYYITPDNGKRFIEWDKKKLLNDNTIIEQDYTFTAQYDWSDLHASSKGLVKTEAFNDPNSTWTNSFAPTIDELKAQIVKTDANGNEVALPADATVTIVDDAGNKLTQDAIYEKVREMSTLDTNELVRTVVFKAKVTFAGNQSDKILDIPVKIYKNVYEALTNGDMPKVLKDATTAPDGDLVDVTDNYVKVTVAPTGNLTNKDNKIYYVNPNAWVNINEVEIQSDEAKGTGFMKWTANKADQNETSGKFDFSKRHKFTENTVITPNFSEDVKEQKDGEDKPDVPDNFVKVIVSTKEAGVEKATDATAFEKTFWVNPTKEVTIPVSKPNGKTIPSSATNPQQIAWIFDNWTSDKNIGPWTDTIRAQFTVDTTITANYTEAKNIIPYDPEDPITRPDKTYVRVKFAAEEGLTLSNIQYYYVKKNSGVKLSDLNHPNYEESTGYKFDKWDKDKTTEIGDADITVTAQANKLNNVIPEKDANGTPNDKPEGYKEVTFVVKTEDAAKGSIDGTKKFYVKPNEYVTINQPATKAETGYEFGTWDKNTTIPTVYKEDTTITGYFNELKAVIPKTTNDDSEKPEGYKTVTFVIDPATGGKIANDEITVYYVNPDKEVTVPRPKTNADIGYEFEKWDQDTTTAKKYADDVTVKGTFIKLPDIIPSTKDDGTSNAQPEGYVTVTFTKGAHGSSITGETVYYVNPQADPAKTLGDSSIVKPTVKADTGYTFKGWDKKDTTFINSDITVNADYTDVGDVIPKLKDDGTENDIPAGYIEVTFDTAANGTITGSTTGETKKVVYVRPNTAVVLKGYEPEVEANTGYKFSGWNVNLSKATIYNSGDVITAQYNSLNDIKTTPDPNYVQVEFRTGPEGTLLGDTELWVIQNKEVTLPAPIVTSKPGHTFKGWDRPLTVTLTKSQEPYIINAQYYNGDNIIPEIDASGKINNKPDGYVTVTFRADDNGKLEGDKDVIRYFVNPDAGIMIVDTINNAAKEILVPMTKADANYVFDKWFEDIDKTKPITTDLEYVARFKLNKVTLTYDAGGADGAVPIPVIVDHGTKLRLAPATNLSKTDAKFAGWMIGDHIYQVGEEVELTKDATATAQWTTDQDIIEYDPVKDPTTRPDDTYVRVNFEADNGLSLTEQKAYYVKKDAGITLAQLTKPNYDPNTGYVFKEWDKADTDTITTDLLVTAKATKLETVIPERDKNGNTNAKPKGYKEVSFVVKTDDKDKGSLVGNTKFYVNPNEYVTITPPKTEASTGFEFGAWSPDPSIPTVYTADTTIIEASFNGLKYVIPKTDDSEKPDGYVTVTFEIEGKGGSIAPKETTVYYVKPNTDVTVPQPKTIPETGYEFDKWDKDTSVADKYTNDPTIIKGRFKKLDDIIPSTDPRTGNTNAQPGGYITVTFDKGDHGKSITGQTVYYVNPKANPAKTIGQITKPTVTADTGYKANGWDKDDNTPISESVDIVVKAQYTPIDDVIPKTKDDESEKPEGYITVTFSTETNGKIKDTTDIKTKVVYVNPNKAVALKGFDPEVTPNTGYDFARWDTTIERAIQYKNNDVIKALYNQIGSIIPKENDQTKKPDGYVTVTFDKGTNGKEITGTTVYYVDPNREVNLPAPTVKPNTGWEQKTGDDAWDSKLTRTFTDENTTITAQYKELDNIIPKTNPDGTENKKPDGYKTVTFIGEHGTLEKPTVYYVKPNTEIWLRDSIFNKMIDKGNPDIGYTSRGGEWYEGDAKVTTRVTITEDKTFTYKFAPLKDVIEKTSDDQEAPNGYVRVTLKPTDKAKDEPKENKENKVYFVNPTKKVTLPEFKPQGKTEKDAIGNNFTYEFAAWTSIKGVYGVWSNPNGKIEGIFTQDTDIEARYTKPEDLAPIAKKGVITQIKVEPKPEDLIKNVYDPKNPENKDNLPDGTTFEYTTDGRPDVSKLGSTTAKVKVTYPNGNTVTVEVPITVVKSVDGIEYNPEDVIPFNPTDLDNPNNPIKRPEGFIKVTFEADAGIRLTEPKAYYVRKNALDKKGNHLKISALQKPSYELAQGYGFENWDKDNITIGESDIVVRARANRVVKPDDKPSYPEVIYRDKIVEKEKIVEKIVRVGENDEMQKEIRYMQGYNGKFRPYDGLTRAEAAQILANALKADGYKYDANYDLSYTDVGNKWYTDAVRVVTQAGVFQGYSDGTFRPQSKITRAEWVATLRRFQDLKEANGNAMMLRSGHWATAEVEAAYEAGWLGVYQDGTAKFDADKPITRQEVAYVSNRAFKRALDKVYLKRSVNTLLTYKDINPSMPLYEDILCASNTLLTDGRYYKANTIILDNLTFNIVTDMMSITQKKFQYNVIR